MGLIDEIRNTPAAAYVYHNNVRYNRVFYKNQLIWQHKNKAASLPADILTCSVQVHNTNDPAYGAYYDGPNYKGSRMSSGSSVSSHAHSCDWVMSDPGLGCQTECSFTVTGILPAGATTLNLRFSPNAYGSSSNIKIYDINGGLVHDGSWQDLYIPQYFDGAHWFVATAKAYSQYADGRQTADADIYVGY